MMKYEYVPAFQSASYAPKLSATLVGRVDFVKRLKLFYGCQASETWHSKRPV
jgi:hypothetical protein